jgi:hypothetical protein
LFRSEHERFVERNRAFTASSLVTEMSASVIDENAAHDLGGYSEKVCPALPIYRTLLD